MWTYNPIGAIQPEKITLRIKDIIESYSFPQKNLSADQYISQGKAKFFDFTFPWYAPNKVGLDDFETLFLHKYYMYQIGQETLALFKLNMQTRLMEEMPRWKQLYETTTMTYDPLVNRKTTRSEDVSDSSSSVSNASFDTQRNGTSSNNQDSQSINSDNPQVTVQSKDYASTMERGKLATTGTTGESGHDSSKSDSTDSGKRQGTYTETGFVGTNQTDNILKYREAILNINSEICEYMRGLFLMVYN